MTRWYVVTPEFNDAGSSYEPPEYGCGVYEVEAPNKRAAMVEAVRQMRREAGYNWLWGIGDTGNPFQGLKVETDEAIDE